jgi:hypothetical protein
MNSNQPVKAKSKTQRFLSRVYLSNSSLALLAFLELAKNNQKQPSTLNQFSRVG